MNTQKPITGPLRWISARDLAAVEFLSRYLKDGPKLAEDAKASGKARGIEGGALRRARGILGVKPRKERGNGQHNHYWWELPPGPPFKLPADVIISKYQKKGPPSVKTRAR